MLQAKNLSYSYPPLFNLKEISLAIKPGEILGIIGHSGSGKSTLLHLLAGLKEPESGEILLDGEAILTPSKKLVPGHEKIKLVTQQNTLFPHISVEENISYELRYFEKNYQRNRVETLAKALDIKSLLEKLPRELSGGEIQRVMFAKALADEPLALLLDEPMANLDRIHKKQVMLNLLEVVNKEQIACVMVTHDIFDAFGLATKLVIMNKGKLIQEGSSESIYYSPKNKYVAELTAELNSLDNHNYFRPEAVIISESGEYSGIVKKVLFQGGFYDILLITETGKQIILRSPLLIKKDSLVRFSVESFIQFN